MSDRPLVWVLACAALAAAWALGPPNQRGAATPMNDQTAEETYFPPPDAEGGWRTLKADEEVRRVAGLDPDKLEEAWQYVSGLSANSSLLVVRRGWLVFERYQGKATRDSNRDMHSCGKAFTSTAVALLMAERPDLFPEGLHTRIYTPRHLPPEAFPFEDPRRARITLGQLLSMTSGLRGNNPALTAEGELTIDPPGPDGSFPESAAFGKTDWRDRFTTRRLWCEPGGGYSYASAGVLILGAMVRHITGMEVSRYMAERVFGPIGWGRWSWYDNPPEPDGSRHTKAQGGISPRPRDAARFGYLHLRLGRWGDRQLLPRRYCELVRRPSPYNPYHPTYSLCFVNNDRHRLFPHAPADTYGPSGALNNHIYIIPSLDMVVVRIGDRERATEPFREVHRNIIERVVAAVLPETRREPRYRPLTRIGAQGTRWSIDGRVTYPGTPAEGLLMNVRMVNSIFEDRNPETCPAEFDPEANLKRFIARLPDYVAQGVRAFTIGLQGGFPGYEGALNSAFNPDGSLRPEYLDRAARVIEACDALGAVVILGCYYQRQDQVLRDADAVRTGVRNVARWLARRGYTNVLLEVANEYPHRGFDHDCIRDPAGMAQLIRLAKEANPALLVSASGVGDGRVHDEVARASDFLLIHFNNTPVEEIRSRVEALRRFGKPIVANEDDKVGEEGTRAARASVEAGCSWGFMHSQQNQYYPFVFQGPEDDPQVYAALKALTSAPAHGAGR